MQFYFYLETWFFIWKVRKAWKRPSWDTGNCVFYLWASSGKVIFKLCFHRNRDKYVEFWFLHCKRLEKKPCKSQWKHFTRKEEHSQRQQERHGNIWLTIFQSWIWREESHYIVLLLFFLNFKQVQQWLSCASFCSPFTYC